MGAGGAAKVDDAHTRTAEGGADHPGVALGVVQEVETGSGFWRVFNVKYGISLQKIFYWDLIRPKRTNFCFSKYKLL